MKVNRIKYTWKDPDGTEHYEILEIEECDMMSLEAYQKEA